MRQNQLRILFNNGKCILFKSVIDIICSFLLHQRAITKQQCSITGELNSRNSKPYIQESVHQIIDSLRTYNSNYRPIEVSNSSADDNNVITKFVVRAIQGKPLLITGKIRDMTKKQKKVLLNPLSYSVLN